MIGGSNCDYGYHVWRDRGPYWECDACHLIERKPRPEAAKKEPE